MSTLSTHVLDTGQGRPAARLDVSLEHLESAGTWRLLKRGTTNADGRVTDLAPGTLAPGTYRLRFETGAYHQTNGIKGFYPYVEIAFDVTDTTAHYHVPLLLSPWGFSTYRGS